MATRNQLGLLILRVGISGLMLFHGIPKLMELLQGNFDFGDPIGIGEVASKILAVIGEAICPLLIIIGLKTRLAAIPAIITMAVAAFVVHGADLFQKKELALLYLVGFVAIALLGPGKFSIDKR